MSSIFTSDNLKLLLSYPFKDSQWKNKLIIGSGIGLIAPFLLLIPCIPLWGYVSHIMENIIHQNEEPYLPEWTDWGDLFKRGLRILGVSFILQLPAFLFLVPGFILVYGAMLIPAFLADDSSTLASLLLTAMFVGILAGGLLLLIGIVISVLTGIFSPAVFGHVVAQSSFSALFKVKDWWPIFRVNVGEYLLCLVVSSAASIGLSLIFQAVSFIFVICCPLYFVFFGFIIFYMCLVFFPLYGQVYRNSLEKLNANKENI